MSTEPQRFYRRFTIGRYVCEMSAEIDGSKMISQKMEWSPHIPTKLSPVLLREYQKKRDHAMAALAAQIGGIALIVDDIDHNYHIAHPDGRIEVKTSEDLQRDAKLLESQEKAEARLEELAEEYPPVQINSSKIPGDRQILDYSQEGYRDRPDYRSSLNHLNYHLFRLVGVRLNAFTEGYYLGALLSVSADTNEILIMNTVEPRLMKTFSQDDIYQVVIFKSPPAVVMKAFDFGSMRSPVKDTLYCSVAAEPGWWKTDHVFPLLDG